MLVKIAHFVTWPFSYLIFKFFNRFQVLGRQNIKGLKKPVIFISNHESYYDPFLIETGLSWFSSLYPVYYLANTDSKVFKNKLFGFFLRFYGAFPGRIGEGVNAAIIKPVKLLGMNKSVGIFPEWCYDDEVGIERINRTIALTAINSGRPIIPVFIYGIFDGGISWKKVLFKKREVKIVYGEPLYIKEGEEVDKAIELIQRSLLSTRLSFTRHFHKEESKFWNNYAQFYHYLEKSDSYKELLDSFGNMLPQEIKGNWVDFGSGSGSIVHLLAQRSRQNNGSILATDFDQTMLEQLNKKFSEFKNIRIKDLDISLSFSFPSEAFDGVTANLVLPYIIHHEGDIGKKSFEKILKEIYRILKPGGYFIWSSPKCGVNFSRVFFSSWRNILDYNNLEHLYYGPAILEQALKIQHKGRCGIYHFLKTEDLSDMLSRIGFKDIKFERSMSKQVDIISCRKL